MCGAALIWWETSKHSTMPVIATEEAWKLKPSSPNASCSITVGTVDTDYALVVDSTTKDSSPHLQCAADSIVVFTYYNFEFKIIFQLYSIS